MKTMKEDAEHFRKWKQQKDKELIQLKAKVGEINIKTDVCFITARKYIFSLIIK